MNLRAFLLVLLALPAVVWAEAPSEHSILESDTWEKLAERYWGEPTLARELAHFAAIDAAETLPVGEVLHLPELIEHRVRPGETLRAISRNQFGPPRHAAALARLNRMDSADTLRSGQHLQIPSFSSSVISRPPPDPKPVLAQPIAVPNPLRSGLRDAVNAFLDGRFDDAVDQLEALRAEILAHGTQEEQRLLLRNLVLVYAAYDRADDACSAYRGYRHVEPDEVWDPDRVSPKVLKLVEDC